MHTNIRKYAAEHGIAEGEALQQGAETKFKQFVKKRCEDLREGVRLRSSTMNPSFFTGMSFAKLWT